MAARRATRPAVAAPEAGRPSLLAIVDSGPLIALFNSRDGWHDVVREWLRTNPDTRLVTTWSVLTELAALLAKRERNGAALDFLRWMDRGAVTLDVPVAGSLHDVLGKAVRFADLPFDLTGASVTEAAERPRIRHVLSIDPDFEVYRDKGGKRLINALFED